MTSQIFNIDTEARLAQMPDFPLPPPASVSYTGPETQQQKTGGDDQAAAGKSRPKIDTGKFIADLLKPGFTFMAKRRGKHWEIADDEAAMLGSAWGDVVDEYFPSLDMGPGVTAIGVTYMVLSPRLALDKKTTAKTAAQPAHDPDIAPKGGQMPSDDDGR